MRDPLQDVMNERARQDQKWGEQNHPDLYWLGILMEEAGEAAPVTCEWVFRRTPNPNPDPEEEGEVWAGCPVCGFADYRATVCYPRHKCLRFERTQEPWRAKKHAVLDGMLDRFISAGKFDHELPSGKLPPAGR